LRAGVASSSTADCGREDRENEEGLAPEETEVGEDEELEEAVAFWRSPVGVASPVEQETRQCIRLLMRALMSRALSRISL
jgi:hypothetical protein